MAKRIMREFTLHEISAVTLPAQKGAKMVIMKTAETPPVDPAPDGERRPRDLSKLAPDELKELIAKGKLRLTSDNAGHAHLIEIDDYAAAKGGGSTYSSGDGGDSYHTHPFVIGKDGEITIGMAKGHTHFVVPITKLSTEPEKEDVMTPEQIARMDSLEKLAGMTDAQKAHLAKLSGDDKTAFQDADYAKREEIIKAAAVVKADDDPIVYTAKDGTEYRKSDGATAVKTAKSLDAMMATVGKITEAGVDAQAEAIAKTDMLHIGMDHAEKVKLAKDILNMPPVLRDQQLAALKKTGDAMAPIFKTFGAMNSDNGAGGEADAAAKLNTMAKEYAKENSVPFSKALIAVNKSPEGQAIYQATKSVRH